MNRLGAVGASLPLGAWAELAPARSPYVWSDLSDSRLQFAGHPELADSLEVKAGSAAGGSYAQVYRRGEREVAVLVVDQRRHLNPVRRWLGLPAVTPGIPVTPALAAHGAQ